MLVALLLDLEVMKVSVSLFLYRLWPIYLRYFTYLFLGPPADCGIGFMVILAYLINEFAKLLIKILFSLMSFGCTPWMVLMVLFMFCLSF